MPQQRHCLISSESALALRTVRFNQEPSVVSYCTILAVAVLGALSGPWYLLLVGAAVLTFTAMRNQRQLQPRFAALGMGGLLETAAYASAAHALLAAVAAYGLGVFTRLVFG